MFVEKKSYTDEELSRILGEHDSGNLVRSGAENWVHGYSCEYPFGCINQVAYNTPENSIADNMNYYPAEWFDAYYYGGISPENLLAEIQEVMDEEQ